MTVITNNSELNRAIQLTIDAFKAGGKLLVCGNGGSSSDSAHIVGELVKGFLKKRTIPAEWKDAVGEYPLQVGLPAIDLTAQSAVISAINNDQGGACVYAQQVGAYGKTGDVFIGISTSGNAENVLIAMKLANALGMVTIAMTGKGGGKLGKICNVLLESDETETYKVQEDHIRMYHQYCAKIEEYFFAE